MNPRKNTLGPVMLEYLITIFQEPNLNVSQVLERRGRQSWPKDRAPIRRLIENGFVRNEGNTKQYSLVITPIGHDLMIEAMLQYSDCPDWIFSAALDSTPAVRTNAMSHPNCPSKLRVLASVADQHTEVSAFSHR